MSTCLSLKPQVGIKVCLYLDSMCHWEAELERVYWLNRVCSSSIVETPRGSLCHVKMVATLSTLQLYETNINLHISDGLLRPTQ